MPVCIHHYLLYHNYSKFSNRQAWANCVDPDQMLQYAASDQGLYCLLSFSSFRQQNGIAQI